MSAAKHRANGRFACAPPLTPEPDGPVEFKRALRTTFAALAHVVNDAKSERERGEEERKRLTASVYFLEKLTRRLRRENVKLQTEIDALKGKRT